MVDIVHATLIPSLMQPLRLTRVPNDLVQTNLVPQITHQHISVNYSKISFTVSGPRLDPDVHCSHRIHDRNFTAHSRGHRLVQNILQEF